MSIKPQDMEDSRTEYLKSWDSDPIAKEPEATADPFAIAWHEGEKVAGDGVSMQTHAGMKAAGVGPYEGKTAAAPAEPPSTGGSTPDWEKDHAARQRAAAAAKYGLPPDASDDAIRRAAMSPKKR
jgi:hypothetical protein